MVCQKAKNGVPGSADTTWSIPAIALATEDACDDSSNSSPPLQKSRHLPSSDGKRSENGAASAVRPAMARVSLAKPQYRATAPTSEPAPTLAQAEVSQSKEKIGESITIEYSEASPGMMPIPDRTCCIRSVPCPAASEMPASMDGTA